VNAGQGIPLDSIDIFWRKLDTSPLTPNENGDITCDDELKKFKEVFEKQSNAGKKVLLEKLKEIYDPSIQAVEEPVVKKNTRGRPRLKKQQEKQQLDRVIRQTLKRSCSTRPNIVEEPVVKKNTRGRPRLKKQQEKQQVHSISQQPGKKSSSTRSNVIEYNFMDLNLSPPSHSSYTGCSDPLLEEIPTIFHPYITKIQNVCGDGHCGFRSIAVCLGCNENKWPEIREELLEDLNQKEDLYRYVFGSDFDSMRESLFFVGTGVAPLRKWMIMPDTGVLIANRFGVIVHFLSKDGSSTCFPLWKGHTEFEYHRVLTIARVHGNHFIAVQLEGDYPLSTVMHLWKHFRHASVAGWVEMYKSRLEKYTELVPGLSNGDDVIDVEKI